MFKNYLIIAWRNLKSNRLFSSINIVGLSIGLAITILLYLFIIQERSFDNMHKNKDHIYRLLLHPTDETDFEIWPQVSPVIAPFLMSDIPGIKSATRLFEHDFGVKASVRVSNTNYIEDSFYWCDDQVFNIFDIDIIKGNKQHPLELPNTVTISETTAEKYFGNENPIGKTISVDNGTLLKVTAVYKDFPVNSTLDCNVMATFQSSGFQNYKGWDNASFETYFLTSENISESQLNNQLNDMLNKYVSKEDKWYYFSAQPFSEVHLYSSDFGESYSSRIGNINDIKNMSLLALLVLVIACINYMNLTTARSQNRSKDVGVNKTLGATTGNMIVRFYTETAILTFISMLLGILLVSVTVPFFNTITQQQLEVSAMLNANFVTGVVLIFLVTIFISGSYPALYLSSFSPRSIFNPSHKIGKSIVLIRKGLVVFQFAASVVLIVSVLVIYGQLQYMKTKNLGFNPEGVIAISTSALKNANDVDALVDEFKQLSVVKAIGKAQGYPGMSVSLRTLRKNEEDQGINIQTNKVDPSVAQVLDLELLSGRMPSLRHQGDSLVEAVLNKKAIDYLGYTPQEAIGKKVLSNLRGNSIIVGVVKNFNFTTLRTPIRAYVLHNSSGDSQSYVLIRFKATYISSILEQFKHTFQQVAPNVAFDYDFIDSTVKKLYSDEQKTANISIVFCGLAIFVACLGLFALANFMAEQRTKEIGVRKVLGASVANIATMLLKDFLTLVMVSLIIAFPIAFFIMNNWLQGFAYRISLRWYIFAIAGLVALAVALVTISTQAIKAAIINPVKNLRSE